MPPSPVSSDEVVHVVTTTITSFSTSPSSFSASSASGTFKFPYASVIGGSLAGIILTIVAVIGWRRWRQSIKRHGEVRQISIDAASVGYAQDIPSPTIRWKQMSNYTTLDNTRHNASTYTPSTLYSPTFTFSPERKVKFASPIGPPEKHVGRTRSPVSSEVALFPNECRLVPVVDRSPSCTLASPPSDPIATISEASSLRPPVPLAHKASNASSLSMYSTQSGEAHQSQPPTSIIHRKLDTRRISSFTRSSRPLSHYSTLGDIDELLLSDDIEALA